MALLRSSKCFQRLVSTTSASYSSHPTFRPTNPIGNREVVGYGYSGQENYVDRFDFPMPAIRYKAPTPDIQALREKEKGDWKKLSMEEKKQLYRASFCRTFAEVDAPTGEWKSIFGCAFAGIGIALWAFIILKQFVLNELPSSFKLENRQKQLKTMIDIAYNPIEGLASNWDYEKGDWKKK